jgi:hypothetical protein
MLSVSSNNNDWLKECSELISQTGFCVVSDVIDDKNCILGVQALKDSYKKEEYYVYFRVLETKDEYFSYYRKRHAFWKMYGMNLPDSVLKKVYYKNALKLFPKIPKWSFEEN